MPKKCLIVVHPESSARSMANLGFKIHGALRDGYEIEVRYPDNKIQGATADVIWKDEAVDSAPFGFAGE